MHPRSLITASIAFGLATAMAMSGCVSSRVVNLENQILRMENERLAKRNSELEARTPSSADFVREPDLDAIAKFLDRAGYVHEMTPDRKAIRLEFAGQHTSFGVNLQIFSRSEILFMATSSYLRLEDARDQRGVILLMVKLAALNYDLPVGKFQLNPETGDILLSFELHLGDGLSYNSFVMALSRLLSTADERYTELERAAAGSGL
ncbi:MAG: hypothetical protein ACI9MC_003456 [Kiritimatiellia bacterium]|jgi:hypothetical protein